MIQVTHDICKTFISIYLICQLIAINMLDEYSNVTSRKENYPKKRKIDESSSPVKVCQYHSRDESMDSTARVQEITSYPAKAEIEIESLE
jgi:hypothetical protein